MLYLKVVVVIGVCVCFGGIFKECYNIFGGVDIVVFVDVYVFGCVLWLEVIMEGILKVV